MNSLLVVQAIPDDHASGEEDNGFSDARVDQTDQTKDDDGDDRCINTAEDENVSEQQHKAAENEKEKKAANHPDVNNIIQVDDESKASSDVHDEKSTTDADQSETTSDTTNQLKESLSPKRPHLTIPRAKSSRGNIVQLTSNKTGNNLNPHQLPASSRVIRRTRSEILPRVVNVRTPLLHQIIEEDPIADLKSPRYYATTLSTVNNQQLVEALKARTLTSATGSNTQRTEGIQSGNGGREEGGKDGMPVPSIVESEHEATIPSTAQPSKTVRQRKVSNSTQQTGSADQGGYKSGHSIHGPLDSNYEGTSGDDDKSGDGKISTATAQSDSPSPTDDRSSVGADKESKSMLQWLLGCFRRRAT